MCLKFGVFRVQTFKGLGFSVLGVWMGFKCF